MLSYAEFAKLPASEKTVLCSVSARTQYKLFTLSSGSVYYKDVPNFVSSVSVDTTPLVKASSTALLAGQYYFDAKSKRLYVRMSDGSNPKTKIIVVTFQFFFSNIPQILPYDLANGEDVEWDCRIDAIGNLGQQLDDENTGIVLESSSQIALHNNDGYFDGIFDTLIWENQSIKFYSWSPLIPVTSAVLLFSGVIESKSYDSDKITFKVKDFVYRLKNLVNLGTFSTSDGEIPDSILGTPKRRIYGRVKQAKCVGIDNTLSGYQMTGTVSVALDSAALTGVGTDFLKELSPRDELYISLDDGVTIAKISIESVESSAGATLGEVSKYSIAGKSAIVKPSIPYRFKNRIWHIAGHKLRAPTATITDVTTSSRIVVDNVNDFVAGDTLDIGGNFVTLRRISGNTMVLSQDIFPVPSVGTIVKRNPVSKSYFGSNEISISRDWTLVNTPTDAYIVLDDLAEFNIANQRTSGVSLTFTNGSRSITTTATIDLRTIIKPRDWIKKNNLLDSVWYEVLDVREQLIVLRTIYAGTTQTTTAKIKNVELVEDGSLITVDCIGMELNGAWVRTASDAVLNLVVNDAGFNEIDTNAFAQAKADCDYILSMVIPESIGSSAPAVRDVITQINESVMGSLYGNQSQQIAYSILNSRKPEDLTVIRDDDIISWKSSTEQKIVNKVQISYRPFVDIFNGQDAFETLEYSSAFVDRFVGIQNTEERKLYLFDTSKAEIMAQRIAFYRTLSNCKISMLGKLSLALVTVNDKAYIEFDRLFNRFGGNDRKKIAIVTGVKKNGSDVEVEMTDLGNIFNRVPSIAPAALPAYSFTTKEDAVRYGFILDNDTNTPDNTSEDSLGNNRIG